MKLVTCLRLLFLALAFVLTEEAQAGTVSANFTSATDVAVTAAGYTATGKTVDFTLNFAPPTGTTLTVVNNTSLNFISGTFANLTQGQVVTLSFGGVDYNFVANYYGGTGNDLVLVWAGSRVLDWGYNLTGELGNNSTANSSVPVDVVANGVLAGKTVVAIAAGYEHNLALCADGTLAAWGWDYYGQLGNNSTTDSHVPMAVNKTGILAGKTVVAIAAGHFHSLALCSDGTLAAWGDNSAGQLGNNSNTDSLVPVAVPTAGTALAGKSVVAIAAGPNFNLALCADGTVVSWGQNTFGQLGNNSYTDSLVPIAVTTVGTPLDGKQVIAMSAGGNFSVVLCSDGTVAAWGSNSFGELGNSNNTSSNVPVALTTVGTPIEGKIVRAVSAGNQHSLALCSDGTLVAWGSNLNGQLGNNGTGTYSAPVGVSTTGVLAGKTVVALAAGYNHSLALCSDGTRVAWGGNSAGELGNSISNLSRVPVAVSTAGTPLAGKPGVAVAANFNRSMAIVAPITPFVSSLTPVVGTASGGTSVTLTGSHLSGASGVTIGGIAATNVVVINDRTLSCTTPAGSVGNASVIVTTPVGSNGPNTLFSYLPSVLTAHFTSASDVPFSFAGFAASQVTINFTLGYAPVTGASLMVVKNTSPNFISGTFSNLAQGQAVALSYNRIIYNFVANYYGGTGNDLVLQWAGTRVIAWGDNRGGQLGNNGSTPSTIPVNVLSTGVLAGKTVIAVSAGDAFSLVLCSDGTLAAWGNNDLGQLGNNSFTSSNVPVVITTVGTALDGKTVIAIASGSYHNLALCSDGTVASWGYNNYGVLGINSIVSSRVPVAVNTGGVLAGKTVVAIAAGLNHSLALCSDGTLAAWGDDSSGQLGNNSTSASAVPVAVYSGAGGALAAKTVVAIAAGYWHSLALCSDGTMAAWGDNSRGQLGNNRTVASSLPVTVSRTGAPLSTRTVVSIAAGGHHSLALCSDGTVATWGYNIAGQLGNDSTSNSLVPIATSTAGLLAGKTVIGMASGEYHSLALCFDGTVAAWGQNNVGQLGNNSTTNSLVPAAVGTDLLALGERIVTVSSGSTASHSLALVAPLPQASVTVSGNSHPIVNGSAASATNDTDFGTVTVINSQLTHVFTIARPSEDSLSLTGSPLIAISGPAAADFHVTQSPATSIAPGDSTTFAITFDPTVPGQRTATVTIANDSVDLPTYSFSLTGFSTLAAKRAQTIHFDAPAVSFTDLLGQPLFPRSSSGLPVSLSISGPGVLGDNNGITYWSPSPIPGTIRITATQAGDSTYLPAPPVVRTITIIKRPNSLTLIYLHQTYDGTPKQIYAVDGGGNEGVVSYKIGASYVANAPTAAGAYAVRGVKGSTTVTGTLVITKAPLLVTLDSKHKFAGQANPSLSFSYSGFINGDTSSVITKAPVPATTATAVSPGGIYPITASGGLAANYTFVFGQGSMVVDTFAGAYEALLLDSNSSPVGKLSINVAATSKSFTAKLATAGETTAVSFTGALVTGNEQATGTATTLVGVAKTPYVINFTLPFYGPVSASATRGGVLLGSATDGQRISTSPVLFAGAHTAVFEPATPAATNVPTGAGWATVAAGSTGVLSFAGKLGDDTVVTASLSPDGLADPGYRLFAQPYMAARAQSYIAGQFNLLPHPSIAKRRYLPQSTLTWNKAGLATDATNRAGFGPVSTVLMIDPWLPNVAATKTTPAITLAQRLGLTGTSFNVAHTATGSAVNGNLPTQLNLSATNVISVLTPLANPTKWKILTFAPTTGTFTGSFELVDGVTKRTPTFSGVFRQPATVTDTLIGDGHYLLTPTSGTEKITGEVIFSK